MVAIQVHPIAVPRGDISWSETATDYRQANLLTDLDLPALVLHDSALRQNLNAFAEFCEERGLFVAPHAKTSMSEYVCGLHLEAGAWGLTAATVSQVKNLMAMRLDPPPRILMANVLVDPLAVRWVADTFLTEHAEQRFSCYVDSPVGLERLTELLRASGAQQPLDVMLEVGYSAGRTGVRSVQAAVQLAREISEHPEVRLIGVAGFEGLTPLDDGEIPSIAHDFLIALRDAAREIHAAGLFPGEEPMIVSAGGSAFFDDVARVLGPGEFEFDTRLVLRSGCYSVHDHGMYEESSPLAGREAESVTGRLRPALELLASVWSLPEPGLAIVGFGRRDAPYDDRLPVLLGRYDSDGSLHPVPGTEVFGMNDQHAYLRIPLDAELKVGDLLSFGISHPCGAFDRWPTIHIVDDRRLTVGETHPRF